MDSTWTAFSPSGDVGKVAASASRLTARQGDLLLVLVAEGSAAALPSLLTALRGLPGPFFGGVFPAVLSGGTRHTRGILLVRFTGGMGPVVIQDLRHSGEGLAPLSTQVVGSGVSSPTAIVLVDGLAPDISRFLEELYNEMGGRVRYWGGGAGVSTFERRPSLFTREGMIEGGAVVAITSMEAQLGVRHGWTEFRGPLVATRTSGNTIRELNWRPARAVYEDLVLEDPVVEADGEDLHALARRFPLGIQKQGQEFVVRDPVRFGEDGSLTCVGDIPENAVLSILRGDPSTLLAGAEEAARAAASWGTDAVTHCLIADCISRVLFLEDGFPRELSAIERGLGPLAARVPPVGVLTLGEISSRGDGYLEFFNKTCVVATLRAR